MSREYGLFIEDIEAACRKIVRYVEGYSYEEFFRDEKTFDAVVRNLEVIGEAVKHLPEDFRREHAGIEWREIAGMRDILTHAYFALDLEVVWNVVQAEIPALLSAILRIQGSTQNEIPRR